MQSRPYPLVMGWLFAFVTLAGSVAPGHAQTASAPAPQTLPVFTERALLLSSPPGPYATPAKISRAPVRESRVAAVLHLHFNGKTGGGFLRANKTDAATLHPPEMSRYGYVIPGWCNRELASMTTAGVDTALIAWWGTPYMVPDSTHWHTWTWEGLRALVPAAEVRRKKGLPTPRIAPRFDGGAFAGQNSANLAVNLETSEGRAWLYTLVRDFYSLVPPALRATDQTGSPLIFLTSLPASKTPFDASVLNYLRLRWAEDFGAPGLHIATFAPEQFANADAYSYPGTPNGRAGHGNIALVRPGTAPQSEELSEDRLNGALYERRWRGLLAQAVERRPRLVVISSWNNWQTGTAIAPSREYKSQYVTLTRRFSDQWRQNRRVPAQTAYTNVQAVSLSFAGGGEALSRGLSPVSPGDGQFQMASADGSGYAEISSSAEKAGYLYLDVDDGFFYDSDKPVQVAMEYWDEGKGAFGLQYDSTDSKNGDQSGTYKQLPTINRTNTRTWKTHTFTLPDARFTGRQNQGGDLRLITETGTTLRIRLVSVQRAQTQ